MWYKNIAGRFFGLVTKHACDRRTDGRTDKQNYDSQDRASIAASRGKNWLRFDKVTDSLNVGTILRHGVYLHGWGVVALVVALVRSL